MVVYYATLLVVLVKQILLHDEQKDFIVRSKREHKPSIHCLDYIGDSNEVVVSIVALSREPRSIIGK